MKVDIYQASKRPGPQTTLYVFVRAGDNPSEKLPPEEQQRLGALQYMKAIDLEPGQKKIGLNVEDAVRNLDEDGYHVQSTEFVIQFRQK